MSYYRTRGMASLGAAPFAGPKEYYVKLTQYAVNRPGHTLGYLKHYKWAGLDDGVTKMPKGKHCDPRECSVSSIWAITANDPSRVKTTLKGPYGTFAEAKKKADDANKGLSYYVPERNISVVSAAEVIAKIRMGSGTSAAPVSVQARASSLLKPAGTVRGGGGGPIIDHNIDGPPAGGGGGGPLPEGPPAGGGGGGGPAAAQTVETENVAVTEQGPVPATPDGRPAEAPAAAAPSISPMLLIGGGLLAAYLLFGRK